MKKRNVVSAVGAIALAVGIALNIQYSLADYGMGSNTLSAFVLAQSGGSGGSSSGGSSSGGSSSGDVVYGAKTEKVTVKCKKTIIVGGNQGSSSGVSGGASAGWGGIGGNISGGTGSSSGSSSSVEIKEEYIADKYLCRPDGSKDVCYPFNPCLQ